MKLATPILYQTVAFQHVMAVEDEDIGIAPEAFVAPQVDAPLFIELNVIDQQCAALEARWRGPEAIQHLLFGVLPSAMKPSCLTISAEGTTRAVSHPRRKAQAGRKISGATETLRMEALEAGPLHPSRPEHALPERMTFPQLADDIRMLDTIRGSAAQGSATKAARRLQAV